MLRNWHQVIATLVALTFIGSASAYYDIWAGVTIDVHQDINVLDPMLLPNDFHIEGLICTSGGTPPVLDNSLLGPFPYFTHSFTKLNPGDPGDCWYWFTADWWMDYGQPGIPYCEVMHLGLLFYVADDNTIIDLQGWWTRDGQQIGDVIGGLANGGLTPVNGFDVTPVADGQVLRLGAEFIAPIVLPPPIGPGPGPFPIDVQILELDVLAIDPSMLPPNWFDELSWGGAQDFWPWVPVGDGAGNEIDPLNPVDMPAGSFFDVYLNDFAGSGSGSFAPMSSPVFIGGGELLLVRSKRTFINNMGQPEANGGLWQWDIHGAQDAEACCFTDGTCQDLAPRDCAAFGGFPMGMGTTCATVQCPQNDEACCLPDGTCVVLPAADCVDQGGQPMGVPTCDDVVCPEPGDYLIEFSLDIGSDTELSDPQRDGDEGFDPGDVYWWQGAPVMFPGRDGFKNDAVIFGTDPWPTPPDATYATAAPVGFGTVQDYAEWFDLDGHDQIDIELVGMIPPEEPLIEPIPPFASMCVYDPYYLMISFDDDRSPGYVVGDVPVGVPSPAGVSSYGSTLGRDETIAVDLAPVMLPPFPITTVTPFADEITVHQSLMPNPDTGDEINDNDVDSLDIVDSAGACPFWYFSPDHEAFLGLDPGGIYLVTGAGVPVQVVDEIHLGLSEDTDIDAFEFAWLPDPQSGMVYFGVLFSVDEDDPLTVGVDESGGLPADMLFGSVLTGYFFEMSPSLGDDIDAVTCWRESLAGKPCLDPGDSNCDGLINNGDIDPFVVAVGSQAAWEALPTSTCDYLCANDINGDGLVNNGDIDPFVALLSP